MKSIYVVVLYYRSLMNIIKKKMVGVGADDQEEEGTTRRMLVFTYGTLKRGFWNHTLMQELMTTGDAVFLGNCRTQERYPLVCGPYRVPFLLNLPGSGQRVMGELYGVSSHGLARMDELEGTSRGHYERLSIKLKLEEPTAMSQSSQCECGGDEAYAYFAHGSYAVELWMKNGRMGLSAYSEEEARGYVKRKDRPQHLTFLEQIHLFVVSSSSSSSSSSLTMTHKLN